MELNPRNDGTASGPSSPPKWHRIYYLLAAFDILVVLLSLLLSHQILKIYSHSLEVNQQWVARRDKNAELGMLAGAVNAPGNNVFDSHNVDGESRKMRAALTVFNQHLEAIQEEFRVQIRQASSSDRLIHPELESLPQDLAAINAAMAEMTNEAELIFAYFGQNKPEKAGRRMATMDQKYAKLLASVATLRAHISKIQEKLFRQELESADSLRKFDYVLGAVVFVMVGAALVYGHKIKNQMQVATREKQSRLEELKTEIAERREAEEVKAELTAKIDSQRQRLNNIVASVPGVVWEAWGEPDAATQRIDFVSDYVETMLGYSVEEWLSTPTFWLAIVHPDDKEKAAREAAEGFASGSNCTSAFRWVTRDGRAIWVESNFMVIIDDEGKSLGLRGVTTDISQRKRAEEQLSRQLDFNEAITSSMGEGVYALDKNGRVTLVNPAAEIALGWTEDELRGREMHGIIHFQDGGGTLKPAAECPLLGVIRSGETISIEDDVFTRKDGSRFHVSYTSSPIITDGQVVGAVLAFRDITERTRAVEELSESAERYRLLFENNPHPMWVYDLERLSFLAVNQAAIQHYGYSREEFLSMTVKDIRPPEDVGTFLDDLSNPRVGVSAAGIWRHRKKDGSIIDVDITSHEFLFAGRRAELVLANDVTERRKLEVQLRHSQKLESIGQLAAGIAHEINTPTQYVGDNLRFLQEAYLAHTELMEKYAELYEAAQLGAVSAKLLKEVRRVIKKADLKYVAVEVPKALRQSQEGLERIAKIVESMKDFAHPDSIEKKAVDLNRAIESTINVARGEWKYVAEMETDFDVELPPVPCLLGELNQMTLNMIINSSHAIADKMKLEGQGKGLIKISTRHEGDWAVMRISDTGMGIPVANRARIFDPFFTTKEVGKGTGQGLAISHTVAEKHGGTITFDTEEGAGTTFIIRLPLHEIAATPEGLMKEAA